MAGQQDAPMRRLFDRHGPCYDLDDTLVRSEPIGRDSQSHGSLGLY